MKRIALALVTLLVVSALGAAAFLLTRPDQVWTTSSEEARAELEECLADLSRVYMRDAQEHCARAVELDPEFVTARLYLANLKNHQQRDADLAELRDVDLDRLSERERLLVRTSLAFADEREDDARRLVDDYLADHPDDPHALHLACQMAWADERWQEAEDCFHRLIETDPNRVQAHNLLGYMAMGRGQFDRAEDLFATYRYIAADQANPHDSMAELLMLTGRYEEARAELERALEIRADFCPAWRHLVETALLQGDLATAREAARGTARHSDCPPDAIDDTRCSVAIWERVVDDDWAGVREVTQSTCRTPDDGLDDFGWVSGEALVFAQRAALTTGDLAAGRRLLDETRAFGARLAERSPVHRVDDGVAGLVAHLEGAQALAEGRPRDAAQAFARADELFAYWGQGGINTFKLFNRVNLAAAQEAAGDSAAAAATLRALDAVNPRFARSHGDVDWSLGTVPRTPPGTEEAPFSLGSDRRGER